MNPTTEELIPEVAKFLVTDPSIPSDVLQPGPARALFGIPLTNLYTFSSPSWWAWKTMWGCPWDRAGTFTGALTLEYRGDGEYRYTPDEQNPFRFERWNGTRVIPGSMTTDGASVPRLLWSVPGMSAVDYLPAAVLHDWLFFRHRTGETDWSFEQANLLMAEAIYTMMKSPVDPYKATEDWRVVVAYHAAVSRFGKAAWVG